MAELATLRTAKQALDEGLIAAEDFDVIKIAFLKAQQIKAGLDAGFITPEDYQQARDSFLHSLDFVVAAHHAPPAPFAHPVNLSSDGANGRQQATTTSRPLNSAQTAQPASRLQQSSSTSRNAPSSTPPINLAPAAGSVPLPPAAQQTPRTNVQQAPRTNGAVAGNPVERVRTTSLMTNGKKSMSGISVSDDCITLFNQVKTKSAFKWVSFRLNDEGNMVIPDLTAAPNSTYDDFVAALPANQCRYAVYDYAYMNADTQQTLNKLVFVNWAPETAQTKSKMMFASTKDFLKSVFDGIGAELQATEAHELDEGEMRERVHQALTRK